MRLLFERGFSPTHAFSAFYRYLREDFGADAVLHFGTHGALEFMPGKQVGPHRRLLAGAPDRRSAQHLSLRRQQPLRRRPGQAAVGRHPDQLSDAAGVAGGPLQGPAGSEGHDPALGGPPPRVRSPSARPWPKPSTSRPPPSTSPPCPAISTPSAAIAQRLAEVEQTLIPSGLHTVGEPVSAEERVDLLGRHGRRSRRGRRPAARPSPPW